MNAIVVQVLLDPTHIETVGSNHTNLLGLEPLGEARVLTSFIPPKHALDSPPHGFKVQLACEIEVPCFVSPQADVHGSSQFTCKSEVDFTLRLQINALTPYSLSYELRHIVADWKMTSFWIYFRLHVNLTRTRTTRPVP